MTEEQKKFEEKYHMKIVVPKTNISENVCSYVLPNNRYLVTAALYKWEGEQGKTVFCLARLDENDDAFMPLYLFKLDDSNIEKTLNSFEIIGKLKDDKILDFNKLFSKK